MFLSRALVYGTLATLLTAGCAAQRTSSAAQELLPPIDIVKLHDDVAAAHKMLAQLRERLERLEAGSGATVRTESRPAATASAAEIAELREKVSALSARVAQLERRGGGGEVAESAAPTAPKPTRSAETEDELYQRALETFRRREYAQAKALFEQVLNAFPKGRYCENAHYWAGECEYGLGRHEAAIRSFRTVLDMGGGAKHDDALLKLGVCYIKTGRRREARKAFELLLQRFPASEYAARAKEYLGRL